jgi:hypothetical protein
MPTDLGYIGRAHLSGDMDMCVHAKYTKYDVCVPGCFITDENAAPTLPCEPVPVAQVERGFALGSTPCTAEKVHCCCTHVVLTGFTLPLRHEKSCVRC